MRAALMGLVLASAASSYAADEKRVAKPIEPPPAQTSASGARSTFDTASLEKAIREAIKEAGDKVDPHADEHAKKEGELVEYTRQLAVYTEDLKRFTLGLFLASTAMLIVAILQLCMFKKQLNQMEADGVSRPQIVVRQIHIWDKGAGRIFGPENKIPLLDPGDLIEVAVCAINIGSRDATVINSDCMVCWRDQKLTMNHPLWGNPNPNRLREVAWTAEIGRGNIKPVDESGAIHPSGTHVWMLSTQVPESDSSELYVIGIVSYQDKLGTRWSTSFARTYDRTTCEFEPYEDDNYEEAQ